MSFLQQIQSISLRVREHPITPIVGMAGLLLIQAVALVVSPIFSLFAVIFNFTVIAFYLKDRITTRFLAVGLTLIILTISLAAIFPVHAPIFLGIATAIGASLYTYSFYKIATSSPALRSQV